MHYEKIIEQLKIINNNCFDHINYGDELLGLLYKCLMKEEDERISLE